MRKGIAGIIIAAIIAVIGITVYRSMPGKNAGQTASGNAMSVMAADNSSTITDSSKPSTVNEVSSDTSVYCVGCGSSDATVASSCADCNSSASSSTVACSDCDASFRIITAEEAKKMIDEEEVTIVDVRRQDEYDNGHIKDAILIPNESIGDTAPDDLPDKDATILVYCRTGIRAKEASGKLADLGYTNVYDIGGIVDWPYETEK